MKFIRHTAAGQFILKHFVKVHLRLKVNISIRILHSGTEVPFRLTIDKFSETRSALIPDYLHIDRLID